MPTLIEFRRGPYSYFTQYVALLEASPYLAGIILPDGTVYEALFVGGHDGQNKLQGGGFQVLNAPPNFVAPQGAVVADLQTKSASIYLDGQWLPLSSASSPPPPPALVTVDGGTWA